MADLCSIRETMKDLLQPRPCEGKKNRTRDLNLNVNM